MMKILITGANGFVASNLIARLQDRGGVSILPITRQSSEDDLRDAAKKADFVFHLAGVNRPLYPKEFAEGNVGFTQSLCDALRLAGRAVPIVYSSSIQAELDNPYGQSKRAAEQVVEQQGLLTGARVHIFRLPNVFGKWCRPNYNSAVATFCHNIARNLPIQIHDPAAALSLVYVDDVVDCLIKLLDDKSGAVPIPQVEPVYQTTVGDLAGLLSAFRDSRMTLVTEQVGTGLTRALYSTYLSYLPKELFAYPLVKHADPRGEFVEFLKTKNSGQFSFFTAFPGITRGGHHHHTKTEKFLVVRGQARFKFRHILTGEKHELLTSGDSPVVVETVPGWSHDITNVGEGELIVFLWANEIFDRSRPDTVINPV